jgi:glycosyltransferase involved in cell wall biosynthesis
LTGMGKTVPPRDPARLAEAVLEVLDHRAKFVQPAGSIVERFSPDATAALYESLFLEILEKKKISRRSATVG